MKKKSIKKSDINQKEKSGKIPEKEQNTLRRLMSEENKQSSRYDKKMIIKGSINKIPKIIWFINMLPMRIFLLLLSYVGYLITYPLSFIMWIFLGDRPISRMQPTNFLFILNRGLLEGGGYSRTIKELPLNLESETPSMKMVYQLSKDFGFESDFEYTWLYNILILGKTHPELGFSYPFVARLMGLAIYGLATLFFTVFI